MRCFAPGGGERNRRYDAPLSSPAPEYLRDAAIVKLILFAGLRVGEIIQLRMNDIILEELKGSVIVREGKGTKRREIPLNMKVRKAMLDYLSVRPDLSSDDLFLGQRNEGV